MQRATGDAATAIVKLLLSIGHFLFFYQKFNSTGMMILLMNLGPSSILTVKLDACISGTHLIERVMNSIIVSRPRQTALLATVEKTDGFPKQSLLHLYWI